MLYNRKDEKHFPSIFQIYQIKIQLELNISKYLDMLHLNVFAIIFFIFKINYKISSEYE